MRNEELRKMGEKQFESKLVELRKDLMKLNAQRASGTPPENPGRIKVIKKTIARILTFSNQKTKEGKNK